MPDKPLTIATYAAGASLAAITLVYVFGPTFFLDEDSSNTSRKTGVVGLTNPANDCFINSVLQALAGLDDLRVYLIRESHRRKLDGQEIYNVEPDDLGLIRGRQMSQYSLEGLQRGIVTQALKEILDKLNERPIYKKTISAQGFVSVLERAFETRISRQQQDAQEFLQVVTERLCDEYHAGQAARRKARRLQNQTNPGEKKSTNDIIFQPPQIVRSTTDTKVPTQENKLEDEHHVFEEGFPFEGKIESQIECQTCGFNPRPTVSKFVTLTLNVPQKPSTSLNSCFDGILKIEFIDDFRCEYCRLVHVRDNKLRELSHTKSSEMRRNLQSDIAKLTKAIDQDPESPPEDVDLGNISQSPKRKIARQMRISQFPKVLAIHLSRSIYSASSYSTKNMAKVAFPETLPLGSVLNQKKYRLLGVITHKGGHNSGHYETFRRQISKMPYSTPHNFGAEGAFSRSQSPNPSALPSPKISPSIPREYYEQGPPADIEPLPSPSLLSPSPTSLSTRSSMSSLRRRPPTSVPKDDSTLQLPSPPPSTSSLKPRTSTASKVPSLADVARLKRRRKKMDNRWWRISDDRIKESKTSEVLSMQKDVYLLFYELDRREDHD